ncbi:MAG: hypothetical protein KBT88_13060 [Gammaproteobacteria bacterium]|nr:hypothetical protein [Gammaproteobacteria bacterium]MBQ0840707.1 hypothetical protein [Gammaproteobacteria bacterium]
MLKKKIPPAIERYVNESKRLFIALDEHLKDRICIARDNCIADKARYPLMIKQGQLPVAIKEGINNETL